MVIVPERKGPTFVVTLNVSVPPPVPAPPPLAIDSQLFPDVTLAAPRGQADDVAVIVTVCGPAAFETV
jgi:hypothetical protein